MNKTGGIVAIIAGVFAVIAALVTLLFGGVASALNAEGGKTVIGLGWGGVMFSFLVIVFGAVSLSKGKSAGWGLIISSILGAFLGGTLVAIFMVLSLIGGILVIAGAKKPAQADASPIAYAADRSATQGTKKWPYVIGAAVLLLGGVGIAAQYAKKDNPQASTSPQPEPGSLSTTTSASTDSNYDLAALAQAPVTGPESRALTEWMDTEGQDQVAMFKRLTGTEVTTDLQRQARAKALQVALADAKGKVVVWEVVVNNVAAAGAGSTGTNYRISTKCKDLENRVVPPAMTQKAHPATDVMLTGRSTEEDKALQLLSGCSVIKVKGIVSQYDAAGKVVLNPAILVQAGDYRAANVVVDDSPNLSATHSTEATTDASARPAQVISEADEREATLAARMADQSEPKQIDNATALKEADKELNGTYTRLMGTLGTDKRAELKRSEIAWIRNKESSCKQDLECLIRFTRQRNEELRSSVQ